MDHVVDDYDIVGDMMMWPPICNGLCLHIVGVHCYQWHRALFSGPTFLRKNTLSGRITRYEMDVGRDDNDDYCKTCCVGRVPHSAAGKYCTQGVFRGYIVKNIGNI